MTEDNANLLPETAAQASYQVLARKYRPKTFEDMIGQEAMVRTLTNAFATDRVAHAFMMTGVRGIGKTTTARLLARALNYETADIKKPSTDFTEIGFHCERIMASTHMDVLEMDAASRTGVENMRELLDGVRYAPVEARYKVYIIDEVHMLSTGAFNALLKTLEEPPDHAKFIFATTELRKVPITVLSRCQRFDLRRVEADILAQHLSKICVAENVAVSADGLAVIARAAEGSVRDSLSLLDQALVQSTADGAEIQADQIRHMLGLGDRSRIFDLFEFIAKGQSPEALAELSQQYKDGADPEIVMRDLLDVCHMLARAKAIGDKAEFDAAPDFVERLQALAKAQSQGQLTRLWQILLSDYEQVRLAPVPLTAAEMSVIKLSLAAEMPPPELAAQILAEIKSGNFSRPGLQIKRSPGATRQRPAPVLQNTQPHAQVVTSASSANDTPAALSPPISKPIENASSDAPQAGGQKFKTLADIVAHMPDSQIGLKLDIERYFHVVNLRHGHIEITKLPKSVKPSLIGRVIDWLNELTGRLWIIEQVEAKGAESLREKREREKNEQDAKDRAHPAFSHSLLKTAKLLDIRASAPKSDIREYHNVDANKDSL